MAFVLRSLNEIYSESLEVSEAAANIIFSADRNGTDNNPTTSRRLRRLIQIVDETIHLADHMEAVELVRMISSEQDIQSSTEEQETDHDEDEDENEPEVVSQGSSADSGSVLSEGSSEVSQGSSADSG
uniref:HPt domain-containing protein n=1 Tax=Meloidogyne hapla TaxID=6305 RepID=A0A1I8BPR7_MELHA